MVQMFQQLHSSIKYLKNNINNIQERSYKIHNASMCTSVGRKNIDMKQLYESPEITVDEFVVDSVILDGSEIEPTPYETMDMVGGSTYDWNWL